MKGFLLALLTAAGLIGAAATLGLVDIRFASSGTHTTRATTHDATDDAPAVDANAIGDPDNGKDAKDETDNRAKPRERPALREIRVKGRDEP